MLFGAFVDKADVVVAVIDIVYFVVVTDVIIVSEVVDANVVARDFKVIADIIIL